VTACQRVGIRSQVQRLSRPHRGDRRSRRRRRGTRPDAVVNGENAAVSPNGSEPIAAEAEPATNGVLEAAPEPAPVESPKEAE